MADPTLVVRVAANLSEFKSNLAEGVDQVETYKAALSRASSAFDGSRIVQQASAAAAAIQNAGGVTALTAAEQAKANAIFTDAADKLQLMGKGGTYAAQQFKDLSEATKGNNEGFGQFESLIERITERFAVYEVLRSAFDFSKEVIEDTARIEVLSLATGISADGIQRLSYVGRQFGIDAEQMARGVEQLSAKLANGDANATKAVEELGLSVQGLMAAGPKEAFLEIAEAVGHVEDPMLKNGLATELFGGKLAKVLIPALGELRQKMEEVPKDSIISDANVKAAHEFEVALGNLKVKAESWGAWILGGLSTYEKWLETQSGVTDSTDLLGRAIATTTGDIALHSETVRTAATAADLLANRLKALRADAIAPLSESQQQAIVELESYGVSHKEIAQLVGTTEIAVKKYTDSVKEQEKAHKAAAEELKKYDELLAHMDKETFTLAMEHEKQWREERLATMKRVNTAVLAEFDAQVKLNAEWGLNAAGAVQVQSSALDVLNQKLAALHATRIEGISQEKQEQVLLDEYTKALYDDAVAQDTVAASTTKIAEASVSATDKFNSFTNTLVLGVKDLDDVNAALSKFYDDLSAFGGVGSMGGSNGVGSAKGGGPSGPRVPGVGHADGIINAAQGHWAMVGERGPEAMYVPQGASIYPNGTTVSSGGGGGSPAPQVIHLVVDGRVLASVVNDHNTRNMKQSRQFPAA